MKTSLKTLFAAVMTALVLSSSVLTSVAAEKNRAFKVTTANDEIKKIIVTGNTKVYLVQSNTESVTMDENDIDKVSVKQIGNELHISSSEASPVAVTVYVKDIFRVDAANTSVVKTVGTFNLKYLQVILRDDAVARIKANTESLYTVTDGRGNLELLGSTAKYTLKTNGIAKLNTNKFDAKATTYLPTAIVMANVR
ncbi:GIN domain-containing protein [Pedobacter sp. L105]|uniref:GIN domain-containing protein n=1 Tax=Pedobacter sp. L105 TaxID=1641871 RepID=UPI00131D9901|nr:DUF2807 domain-containing protein [Pedobacter sp. L105]